MSLDPDLQLASTATMVEQWIDASIRHQIGLIRVAGGIRNKVLALLDATERDVRMEIRERLRNVGGLTSTRDIRRLRKLEEAIRDIRKSPWAASRSLWRKEMRLIALKEPAFQSSMLKTISPVRLNPVLPPAEKLTSLVTTSPFEGRTLSQWGQSIERADLNRITDQIRIGIVQGERGAQIARRVTGTARLQGIDGITQISRRQAQALTNTAVNHFANQSRQVFSEANSGLIDKEIIIATLDTSTTRICASLDGERFDLGEGPIPPLHFGCRSLRIPLLDADPIGDRPFKSSTEQQLVREFAQKNGLSSQLRRRASLPRGTKGLFDTFSRGRVREMIGRTPAKTTFHQFLTRQGSKFQNDYLGPTRAKLFRKGVTLKQFVDPSGRDLTLSELASSHADTFRSAGLEPDDFLR